MAWNNSVKCLLIPSLYSSLVFTLSCKRPQDVRRDIPLVKSVSLPTTGTDETSGKVESKKSGDLTYGPCDGIELAATCYKVQAVGRCHQDQSGPQKLRSYLYPNQTVECTLAGFSIDEYPYFRTISSGGILYNRWSKNSADGLVVTYLREGEVTNALDVGYKFENAAFRVIPESEINGFQGFVPLFKCLAPCKTTNSVCEPSPTWFSLESKCDRLGENMGIIGYVLKP